MAAKKTNEPTVVGSTRTTHRRARSSSTPREQTIAPQFADSFTISYADPGPIVGLNSWRAGVEAKVVVPPDEETPIFAATEAETKTSEGADTTKAATEPE